MKSFNVTIDITLNGCYIKIMKCNKNNYNKSNYNKTRRKIIMKIAVVCANEKAGKLIVAEAVERGQGLCLPERPI